ncbi:hypothetical protein FKW77_002157 [Venturia effusa]|uniref:Uncharacterized protein n=1 Tax=Venturia effusa TaxID=50376 RepID=A0A517KZ68_9PEZI|nr:hypothetical protein FKW77_002157 [Venturia effusa]
MSGHGEKRKRDTEDVGARGESDEGGDSDDSDRDGSPQGCSWCCCRWLCTWWRRRAEEAEARQTLVPSAEGTNAVAVGDRPNGDGNPDGNAAADGGPDYRGNEQVGHASATDGRIQHRDHPRQPNDDTSAGSTSNETESSEDGSPYVTPQTHIPSKRAVDASSATEHYKRDRVKRQRLQSRLFIVDREEFNIADKAVQGLKEPDWNDPRDSSHFARNPLYFANSADYEAASKVVQELRRIRSIEQLRCDGARKRGENENSEPRRVGNPRQKRRAKNGVMNREREGFKIRTPSPTSVDNSEDSSDDSSIIEESTDIDSRGQRERTRLLSVAPKSKIPTATRKHTDPLDGQISKPARNSAFVNDDGLATKRTHVVGYTAIGKASVNPTRPPTNPRIGGAMDKIHGKATRTPAVRARSSMETTTPVPKPQAVSQEDLIKASGALHRRTVEKAQHPPRESVDDRPLTPTQTLMAERRQELQRINKSVAASLSKLPEMFLAPTNLDDDSAAAKKDGRVLEQPRQGQRQLRGSKKAEGVGDQRREREARSAEQSSNPLKRPRSASRGEDPRENKRRKDGATTSAASTPAAPPSALPRLTTATPFPTAVATSSKEISENGKKYFQNLRNAEALMTEGQSLPSFRQPITNSDSGQITSSSLLSTDGEPQQQLTQHPVPAKVIPPKKVPTASKTGAKPNKSPVKTVPSKPPPISIDALRDQYGDEQNWPKDLKKKVFDGIFSPKAEVPRPFEPRKQPQMPWTEPYKPVTKHTNVFDQSYTGGVMPRPKGPELFPQTDHDEHGTELGHPEGTSTPTPVATEAGDIHYPILYPSLPNADGTPGLGHDTVDDEEDVSLDEVMGQEEFMQMLNDLLIKKQGQLRTQGLSPQDVDREVKRTEHEVYNRVASLTKRSQFMEIFDELNRMDWEAEGGDGKDGHERDDRLDRETGPGDTGPSTFQVPEDSSSDESDEEGEVERRQQYRQNHRDMLEREFPDATARRNFTRTLHMFARQLRDYRDPDQFLKDMANYHPAGIAALRRPQAVVDEDEPNYSLAWRVALIVEGRTVAPYVASAHRLYHDEELWDEDSEDEGDPNRGLLDEDEDESWGNGGDRGGGERGRLDEDDGEHDDGEHDDGEHDDGEHDDGEHDDGEHDDGEDDDEEDDDGDDDGGDDEDDDEDDEDYSDDDGEDLLPPPRRPGEHDSHETDEDDGDDSPSPPPPNGSRIAKDWGRMGHHQVRPSTTSGQNNQHGYDLPINPFTGQPIKSAAAAAPLFGRGSVNPVAEGFGKASMNRTPSTTGEAARTALEERARLQQGQPTPTGGRSKKVDSRPPVGPKAKTDTRVQGSQGSGSTSRAAHFTGYDSGIPTSPGRNNNPGGGRGSQVSQRGSNTWVSPHLRASSGTVRDHGKPVGQGGASQYPSTDHGNGQTTPYGRPSTPQGSNPFIKLGDKKKGLRSVGVDITGDDMHMIEEKWNAHGRPLPADVQGQVSPAGGTPSSNDWAIDRPGPRSTTPLAYTPMAEMKAALRAAGVYYGPNPTPSDLKEAYAKLLRDGGDAGSTLSPDSYGQPGPSMNSRTSRQPTLGSTNQFDARPPHVSPHTSSRDRDDRPGTGQGHSRSDTPETPYGPETVHATSQEAMKQYLAANHVRYHPRIKHGQLIKLYEETRTRVQRNGQASSSITSAPVTPPALGPDELMDFLDEHGVYYPRILEPDTLYKIYQAFRTGGKVKMRDGPPPGRKTGHGSSAQSALPFATHSGGQPSITTMLALIDHHKIVGVALCQTAEAEVKVADNRGVDIKDEEVKVQVPRDGDHKEAVPKAVEMFSQAHLLSETITRIGEQVAIATHLVIEAVEIGTEETQVGPAGVDFTGVAAAETPQLWSISMAILAWVRQTVGPHPKHLVTRDTTDTAIVTKIRTLDLPRIITAGEILQSEATTTLEGMVVILDQVVGKGAPNSLILKSFGLPRLKIHRDSHEASGLVTRLTSCAHALMGPMEVAMKRIEMPLVVVEEGAGAL